MTVYRDRIKTIEASTNVQIDPSGVPDCRVSDGVRDAINSARTGPTVQVPAELKLECPPPK